MWKEGCQIELSIYDTSKWWSIFSVFKPTSVAVKYDTGLYIILKGKLLYKIREDKIKTKITNTQTKPVECRGWYVGKIWLDNCIISGRKFEDAKQFASEYCNIVGSFQ